MDSPYRNVVQRIYDLALNGSYICHQLFAAIFCVRELGLKKICECIHKIKASYLAFDLTGQQCLHYVSRMSIIHFEYDRI